MEFVFQFAITNAIKMEVSFVRQSLTLLNMKATIRDVAKAAGVSPSTVSRVLTKSAYVAEEKQEKVLEAIEKLNFQPNVVARSLRLKTSRIIGLLIPDITNPFFPEIAKGIEDAAHKNGYNIMLCNTENDVKKEMNYVELLKGRQADGLIIAKAGEELDHLKDTIRSGIPISFIDRPVNLDEADQIVSNNHLGMKIAVEKLYATGHRKIGLVAGPKHLRVADERFQGFRAGMLAQNLAINEKWIFHEVFSVSGGRSAGLKLLEMPAHPTAMICSSDVLAIGFIDSLFEAGFSVPEYMSVIGFDDINFTKYLKPKLTTIRQAKYEMGAKALELLLKRIKSKEESPEKIVLDVALEDRETVAKPRKK